MNSLTFVGEHRLDMLHHICLLVLRGELHTAPIGPNPTKILDLGTGTGIWAIDMGEYVPWGCPIL